MGAGLGANLDFKYGCGLDLDEEVVALCSVGIVAVAVLSLASDAELEAPQRLRRWVPYQLGPTVRRQLCEIIGTQGSNALAQT